MRFFKQYVYRVVSDYIAVIVKEAASNVKTLKIVDGNLDPFKTLSMLLSNPSSTKRETRKPPLTHEALTFVLNS